MSTAPGPSQQPLKTLLAILIAGGVFFVLWSLDTFEGSERHIRDIYVDALSSPAQSNLVILEIDATSIESVGKWPWPRDLYAQAINRLVDAEIRSLMIDIDFSARSQPDSDAALANALASIPSGTPVHLPVFVQNRSLNDDALMLREPLAPFSPHARPVSVNMQPEPDGLVRFLKLGFQWQDRFYPSAWNALANNLDHATWIDYSISPRSFTYISFADLLAGQVPARLLEGRDVLIGSTAIELGDNLAVPVYQVLPGVVVQALGVETLRRGGLFKLSKPAGAALLAIFWLLAAIVLVRLTWRRGLQAITAVVLAMTTVAVCSYVYANLIVDLVAPLAIWMLVYVAINLARLDTESLERLWLQVTLRDSQTLHDRIISTANDCILCVDRDGIITQANPSVQALCRTSQADLVGSPLGNWLPEAKRGAAVLPSKPFDTEMLDRDGHRVPVEATISIVDLSSEPIYTVVLRDLSDRVAREQELRYQASHDLLTGLLNRTAFFRHVSQTIPANRAGCVLSLNLDYFREVNDTYGHEAGDQLLKIVAVRMEVQLGNLGCAARVGGDGFALWLPGLRFAGGGHEFCDYLLKALEAPMTLTEGSAINRGIEVQIFATVGVAEINDSTASLNGPIPEAQGDLDAEALLRKSADAMLLAKSEGVAVRCYSADDNHAATRRLELVPAIRTHIQNDAFHLVYQPKLNLATGQPIGVEVLLRWPDNQGEIIPVGMFIEVAENSRQIAPLTLWVVRRLLRQEAEWQALGLPRQLAINLSARLFQDYHFIAEFKELLRTSSGYYQFEFEITETALMGNTKRAITLINDLLEVGGTLSIDDYGTGYSSLAYLQAMNASVLKIDKSFVTHVQQDPSNQVIVQSTVKMAHELGMAVVAEGVETASDEAFLEGIACDYVQGYYYAKPLTQAGLESWLKRWSDQNGQLHAVR